MNRNQPDRFARSRAIASIVLSTLTIVGCTTDDDVLSQLLPAIDLRGGHADLQQGDKEAAPDSQETRRAPKIIATLISPKSAIPPAETQSDFGAAMNHLRKHEYDRALEIASKLVLDNPNDPAAYNIQGAAYAGKNDLARARESFEKALRLRPSDITTLLNLAELDIRQKDRAAAVNRYQAVLAVDAKNIAAMIGMASMEAANGKDKESLAWLEKAKAANPGAVAPSLAIAGHYLRHKNSAMALRELTEAQRSHPDNPEILSALGRVQLASGAKADAVATYKRLVGVLPQSPAAYYQLAMAQANNDSLSDANESLRKAIQLKPDYPEAVEALAGLEVRAGRPQEAIKLAKDLQRAAPNAPAGLALEGDLLMIQNRAADAVKAYQGAFALQQTGVLVAKLHAAETRAGNPKEADAKLQQWLKAHPDDLVALRYAAAQNLRASRDNAAAKQYERVLQIAPDDVTTLNNLAIVYQRTKDARALATAERAYQLNPDSPMVADTLGWILVEEGKTARGLELIRKAASHTPVNPEVRYHLAVALARSGDKASAKKELESLLAGDQAFPQRDAAQQLLRQL